VLTKDVHNLPVHEMPEQLKTSASLTARSTTGCLKTNTIRYELTACWSHAKILRYTSHVYIHKHTQQQTQ